MQDFFAGHATRMQGDLGVGKEWTALYMGRLLC